MNSNQRKFGIGRIAMTVLLTSTLTAVAYSQGNGQPSGQAGAQSGATNVVVTNTPAQPVPMRDMDNPAKQPFHFTAPLTTNIAFANVNVPVPAGKRLVIEQISAAVHLLGSQGSFPSASVRATTGGVEAYAWVPMTYVGIGDNGFDYFAMHQVRLYADGGTNAVLTLFKSRDINNLYTGTVGGTISITGYLVNIP
jgi:hypothetical protein